MTPAQSVLAHVKAATGRTVALRDVARVIHGQGMESHPCDQAIGAALRRLSGAQHGTLLVLCAKVEHKPEEWV